MATTVASNSDNGYGHLNLPNNTHPHQITRQSTEPAYSDPDVIPSRAHIPYEDIDLQNQHQDPIPYASTGIHAGHQNPNNSRYEEAYASTADTTGRNASSKPLLPGQPSAIPPYAKVKKAKKQSSFDIESNTEGWDDADSSDGQRHEYGHLKHPITSAAGGVLYHKLDRGLNKEIVDSAR